jgi:cytochrome c oxidase subunit I+III
VWLQAEQWPPPGHVLPGLQWAVAGMLMLAGSSLLVRRARRANAGGQPGQLRLWLLVAGVLMLCFLGTQVLNLAAYGQSPQSHAYASMTHVLVGYQGLHALIAVLMAGYVWLRSQHGLIDATRERDLRVMSLFWHYTVALWLVGAVLVHLFPRWT